MRREGETYIAWCDLANGGLSCAQGGGACHDPAPHLTWGATIVRGNITV